MPGLTCRLQVWHACLDVNIQVEVLHEVDITCSMVVLFGVDVIFDAALNDNTDHKRCKTLLCT